MTASFGVLPALALAGSFLAAWPAGAPAAPSVAHLGNGLRVVLAPDSSASAVDVAVWYPTGPRWEGEGQAGISHLIERLALRGSADFGDGQYLARIAAQGGIANSVNAPDYACFWETIPAEALPLALRMEADRMAGLVTSPAAFEQERAAAAADARSRADRQRRAPDVAAALSRLHAELFAGDPYGRDLNGSPADLERLGPGDVEAWRRAHYGAGSAVLTIVGRFDAGATLDLARRLFERLPRGAAPAAPPAPAPLAARHAWGTGEVPVRLLLAGWRVPGAADPDTPTLQVIAELMGGGSSARLQRALVGQWKVAAVTQAGYVAHRDAAMLWGLAALAADADSSTAERVMLDEFARLGREAPAGTEVDRARARVIAGERLRLQGVRARAASIGEGLMFAGDADDEEHRLAVIARVTPADVQRVAQRALVEPALAVVWVSPVGGAR